MGVSDYTGTLTLARTAQVAGGALLAAQGDLQVEECPLCPVFHVSHPAGLSKPPRSVTASFSCLRACVKSQRTCCTTSHSLKNNSNKNKISLLCVGEDTWKEHASMQHGGRSERLAKWALLVARSRQRQTDAFEPQVLIFLNVAVSYPESILSKGDLTAELGVHMQRKQAKRSTLSPSEPLFATGQALAQKHLHPPLNCSWTRGLRGENRGIAILPSLSIF